MLRRYTGSATTNAAGRFSHSLVLTGLALEAGINQAWSIHAEYAGDAARSPAVSGTCYAYSHID